jgi:hypothetical protein
MAPVESAIEGKGQTQKGGMRATSNLDSDIGTGDEESRTAQGEGA